jgi:hypothetical protein
MTAVDRLGLQAFALSVPETQAYRTERPLKAET